MKVQTIHLSGSIYQIGSGSAVRRLPNAEPQKVLRIRQGCGEGWYQVQLEPGGLYCDVRRNDLIGERTTDYDAIEAVTPRKLPDYVDVCLSSQS